MDDHITEYLDFYLIPSCVYLNENLPYAALGIFSTIKGVTKGTGKCEVTNAYFKRFMRGNPSDVYIQKCLSALEDEGYIIRTHIKRKVVDSNGKEKFETKRQISICIDYEDRHADLIPELGSLNKNSYLNHPPKPIVSGGNKPIVSTNSIVNRITSSKEDNIVSDETKDFNIPFLLEEWRKHKQVPKSQHHPKAGTKVHTEIEKYTNHLLNGTFGTFCTIKPDFLKQNDIAKEALNYKYSKEDLLDALEEMAKMFIEGYYPQDKSSIKKRSFAGLLYCPRTRISYILKFLKNDIKELECNTYKVYEHWLDKVYNEGIFDSDIENDHYQFGLLKKGLAGIEDYHDWLIETVHPIPSQVRKQDQFFNTYIDWVLNYNFNSISVHSIGTNNGKWWIFIKWLEEAVYGDYVSSSQSLDRRDY